MSDTKVLDRGVARRHPAAQHADGEAGLAEIGLAVYDRLDAVEREWWEFEQHADCTPFQTYDWLATWCDEVGPHLRARPAIVVGRRQDGATLFILPLVVTGGAVRRLTWLGSDLCDYNGPLLAAEFSSRVPAQTFRRLWRDIRACLQADPQHRHDLVELTKMGARVGGQINPFLALPVGLNPSHAYVADLSGTWESFYEAKRSSATRRRDRTKLKRLAEFGEIRFLMPQDDTDIAHTMDVLVEQKIRSLKRMGAPNIFAKPGWREFYTKVAASPRMRGLVHVSRLDAGPIVTATNLGLIFRDSYYHVLVSHDDGEASRFGPGVAHLRELLRYAIARGLKRFDFTIGDERYKLEWADHKIPLYDHVAAATMRGLVVLPLVAGHRRLKRFIKQNDRLWSAFSRARAAFGSKAGKADETPPVRTSPPIAPN